MGLGGGQRAGSDRARTIVSAASIKADAVELDTDSVGAARRRLDGDRRLPSLTVQQGFARMLAGMMTNLHWQQFDGERSYREIRAYAKALDAASERAGEIIVSKTLSNHLQAHHPRQIRNGYLKFDRIKAVIWCTMPPIDYDAEEYVAVNWSKDFGVRKITEIEMHRGYITRDDIERSLKKIPGGVYEIVHWLTDPDRDPRSYWIKEIALDENFPHVRLSIYTEAEVVSFRLRWDV